MRRHSGKTQLVFVSFDPEGAEVPTTKTAIVTGVSRGFGRAVAIELLRAGWTVVGDGRDESALQQLCVDVASISDKLDVVPGDIANAEHLSDLVRNAERYGALELVVNNAGALGPTPLPALVELDPAALSDILAINVVAQLSLIQTAVPRMSSGGCVISISSDAAVNAYEGWGAYGASKAALDHIMAVLAEENPTFKWYSLDPGDMRTEMHQAAFPGEDISDRPLPEASAPAVLALVTGEWSSGRYVAADVLNHAA